MDARSSMEPGSVSVTQEETVVSEQDSSEANGCLRAPPIC